MFNEQLATPEDFVEFFARHLVSLWYTIEDVDHEGRPSKGEINWFVGSGFILEISGFSFVVTAGHIIHQLDEAVSHSALVDCRIVDIWGPTAKYPPNVPVLPYSMLDRYNLGYVGHSAEKDTGMDYGVIHLDTNTSAVIAANGIVAIREENWQQSESFREGFLVVGTPASGVHVGRSANGRPFLRGISPAAIFMEEVNEPPPEIKKPFSRIYCRVPGDGHIGGMSGGPLLGLKRVGETWEYKPIGIQSGWLEESRIAAYCPLDIFANWIKDQTDRILSLASAKRNMSAS